MNGSRIQLARLDSIQYLRFFAAGLVVADHCYAMVPRVGRGDLGSDFSLGASGVDIFFAISGFIMLLITETHEQSSLDFLLHRLARVAPIYWLMTALMSLVLLISPSVFYASKFSVPAFVASIFFFPWPHATLTGAWPVLTVGWTLNYEFLFYILFAVGLSISYRQRAAAAIAMLLVLAAIGFAVQPTGVRAQFYTSPLLLEFVFGILIARLFIVSKLPGLGSSIALVVVGVISLLVMIHFPITRLSLWRPIAWGVPAAITVLGAVGIEAAGRIPYIKSLRALGDASYSIYLTHLFTLGAVRAIWSKFHLAFVVSDAFLLGFGAAFSFLTGYIVYRFLERPLVAVAQRIRTNLIHLNSDPSDERCKGQTTSFGKQVTANFGRRLS